MKSVRISTVAPDSESKGSAVDIMSLKNLDLIAILRPLAEIFVRYKQISS
ncbi:hypothetical protein AAY473_031680 [Plecturocebus cupreus]